MKRTPPPPENLRAEENVETKQDDQVQTHEVDESIEQTNNEHVLDASPQSSVDSGDTETISEESKDDRSVPEKEKETMKEENSSPVGHFPDDFEGGTFNQLPWKVVNGLWTVENTAENAPFAGQYSAFTTVDRVEKGSSADLHLKLHAPSGGNFCIDIYASMQMPWEALQLYLDSELIFQISNVVEWEELCADIPEGAHELKWSLIMPGLPTPNPDEIAKPSSGVVMIDNVRFHPNPKDQFESGDFSRLPWRHSGDGEPWTIDDGTAFEGQYSASARAGTITDGSEGSSDLELTIDFGTGGGGHIMFHVKTKTSSGTRDCLWFYIDGKRIRPFFGTKGWSSYKHPVKEGPHTLTWSFESSGQDPNAAVWIDNLQYFPKNGEKKENKLSSSNTVHLSPIAEGDRSESKAKS